MKTMIAIQNPKAGHVGKNALRTKVSDYLKQHGIELTIIETQSPGHATQIAKEMYDKGHRDFLCFGGDGTLFEIINGLFQDHSLDQNVRLAVIPTGTGNSFLKDFSTSVEHTLESIVHNKTKPSDVMEVKHAKGTLYFINIFSFGFTSKVGMVRNRYFSSAGHAGYIFAVLTTLLGLRPTTYRYKLDQQPTTTTSSVFVSLNNTRFTGGNMMMAPSANPSDGLIDVINVKKMGRWKLLTAFPKIFKGTHANMPQVESNKVKHIHFDFQSEIPVMIDGELLTIQPQDLDVKPKAINIYA